MKQKILFFARKIHLLPFLEKIRLITVIIKNHKNNREYIKNKSSIEQISPKRIQKELYPPYHLMYDAYSNCNYGVYDQSGLHDAKMIMEIIRRFTSDNQLVICEFGCGPARIIRHLRSVDEGISRLIGTDYNIKTIKWCKKFITGIDFINNKLEPPFDLPDNSIDVLYCISVFTHLSEEMHFKWIREIRRVLRGGGVLVASFHGNETINKLLPEEKVKFLRGELVTRENVKEGSRIYTAYHNDKFITDKLLADFKFVSKENVAFNQSLWCAK